MSFTDGAETLAVLGRRSNGPGEIVSNRLEIFSPAFIRGLSGANNGLGAAYPYCAFGSRRSLGRGLLRGLSLFPGNGGNAQSKFELRSGEDCAVARGSGVVALRFMGKGDLGGCRSADLAERCDESLLLLLGESSTGRNGLFAALGSI